MIKPQTQICANGIKAKGRLELIKHLEGKRLTRSQAILAKCYECTGYYHDGKQSCQIPGCPLFSWMPYRDVVE